MKEYAEQDVLQLGKRIHNTKRSYLLVNPLQAKHIPVSPTKTYEMTALPHSTGCPYGNRFCRNRYGYSGDGGYEFSGGYRLFTYDP